MANLNSSLEGFNVNNLASDMCEVNQLFYHQINRSLGNSSADIEISFDETLMETGMELQIGMFCHQYGKLLLEA
jgi:hypothetical protein